jgi:hypothetical protein
VKFSFFALWVGVKQLPRNLVVWEDDDFTHFFVWVTSFRRSRR